LPSRGCIRSNHYFFNCELITHTYEETVDLKIAGDSVSLSNFCQEAVLFVGHLLRLSEVVKEAVLLVRYLLRLRIMVKIAGYLIKLQLS
jgi:hypothetical protein